MRITFRLKTFEGHAGIPGHQGGSLPENGDSFDTYGLVDGSVIWRIRRGTILPDRLVEMLRGNEDPVSVIYNHATNTWHVSEESINEVAHGNFVNEAMDGKNPDYSEEIQSRGIFDIKDNSLLLYDFESMADTFTTDPLAEKKIKLLMKKNLREAQSSIFYVKNENGRPVKLNIDIEDISTMLG